ncbi:IS66 family insertion sequence element accessory protein TnpB [Xenorhabdus sp. KJ12.1]|uniref:IS66 family insertion sequence element accessory protein TnpB n=1 Tax=Xenorhabdus sp. KJ12.1 TaxID=1851571 RepID=UPI000C067AEA|nr:IS66 family insertion sequence element accessory protein TnpB [Xenorhabdus sp. KJ12.1]PHM64881.1 transposase [Xenorhabdus sp. KJ12.1]
MIPVGNLYLVSGPTDMRKSIDGLANVVDALGLDPLSEAGFTFCNRHRDKLKILFWDTNGFWLYYRRLEKGRFQWPAPVADGTRPQLNWLLSGLALTHPRAHQPLQGLKM